METLQGKKPFFHAQGSFKILGYFAFRVKRKYANTHLDVYFSSDLCPGHLVAMW